MSRCLLEFLAFEANAKCLDQSLYFGVFVHLCVIRLLDIDDLSSEGQDRLVESVSSLLCAASSRVSLDNVNLRVFWISGGAICEFPWKGGRLQNGLSAHQLPRGPCGERSVIRLSRLTRSIAIVHGGKQSRRQA